MNIVNESVLYIWNLLRGSYTYTQSWVLSTKRGAQPEGCKLSFIWGKMRTEAREAALPRCWEGLALRDCSKDVVREGQYIRFWWWEEFNIINIHFTKGFMLVTGSDITMKGFSALLGVRRCKDWDYKICSWNIYLKICPTRLPGAQSISLYPELSQGVLKVNSCHSAGFSLHRAKWSHSVMSDSLRPHGL